MDGREEAASGSMKEATDFGGKKFIVHSLRCVMCTHDGSVSEYIMCGRVAGVDVVARCCGTAMGWSIAFHAESLSQHYILFDKLLSQMPERPDLVPLITTVFMDYACGLRQFVHDREGSGAPGDPQGVFGSHGVPLPDFVVDRFHFGKHDDEYCRSHCDPSKHPRLRHINSEVCEQLFSWLGRYKFSMGNMTMTVFQFFVNTLLIERNAFIDVGIVI